MKVERVDSIAEFKELRAVWDGLLSESPTNTIFQNFDWHLSWLKAFGSVGELCVLLAREGEEIKGIAPLIIEPRRVNGLMESVVCFIGASNFCSDIVDFIGSAANEVSELFMNWLFDNSQLWTLIDFVNIPSESPSLQPIQSALASTGYAGQSVKFQSAPTRLLNDEQSDRKLLSKQKLKRRYNYFKREGELRFWHANEAAEIKQMLPGFFKLHMERHGHSRFEDNAYVQFYHQIIDALGTGVVRFATLSFNGESLAHHFGFEFGGRYVWYQPVFDQNWSKRAPGNVLLRACLEYAMDSGLEEFDFSIGDEAYKYDYANEIRSTHRVTVYKRPSSLLLARLRKQARKILNSEPLMKVVNH